jgi:hypothetical protein
MKILVPSATIYRGHAIVPKRDFGTYGFFIKGRYVKKGFVVVKDGCNVMPGACWFRTIEEAQHAIRVLIKTKGNAEHFWEIMQPFGCVVGQKARDNGSFMGETSVSCGRFHAKIVGGVVTEAWRSSTRAWDTSKSLPFRRGARDSII